MKKILCIILLQLSHTAWGWTLLGSQLQGWASPSIAIHVNTDDCPIESLELLDQIDRALAVWNGLPLSDLTLVRADGNATVTPSDYLAGTTEQMPIIFCDPNFATTTGDEDEVPAATRVSVNEAGTHLTRSAIFLNAQSGALARISNLTSEQFRVVLAHEVGHLLGLGHSSQVESLMYFNIGGKPDALVADDDIQGIAFLYPRNEFSREPFGCASVPFSPMGWGFPAGILYLMGLVALGRFRRRSKLPS